jgi:hypothetical protein
MKVIAFATLFATGSAIQRTNEDTLHPAYTSFAHSQDDVVSDNDMSLKRKEKIKKNNVNGKMSLATLKFEQFQDVDRSGQPITGEVANILAALPNRQLDTNFLSNLM